MEKKLQLCVLNFSYSYKLSGCWLCLRLLDLLVSFGLISNDGRRGLPSVTSALATANPAD